MGGVSKGRWVESREGEEGGWSQGRARKVGGVKGGRGRWVESRKGEEGGWSQGRVRRVGGVKGG